MLSREGTNSIIKTCVVEAVLAIIVLVLDVLKLTFGIHLTTAAV